MISTKKKENVMVKMRIIVKQIIVFALMINLSAQESTYLCLLYTSDAADE